MQARVVSNLGSSVSDIAFALLIVELTDSATFMGIVMMCGSATGILLSPFGGALADRHCRRRLLLFCDTAFGVLAITFAYLCFQYRGISQVMTASFIAYVVLQRVVLAIFSPTINALLSDILPKENIPHGNAMLLSTSGFADLFGKAFGGVLFTLFGGPLLFLLDSLTFLYGAICTAFLKTSRTVQHYRTQREQKSIYHDTLDGLAYCVRQAGLKQYLTLCTVVVFLFEPLYVVLPFYVKEPTLHNFGSQWYGYLVGALGGGHAAGYWLAADFRNRITGQGGALLALLALEGIMYALLGLVGNPWGCLALIALVGILAGIYGNSCLSIIQTDIPEGLRARVLALMATFSLSISPIAIGIAGFVVDWSGRRLDIILVCCGIAISCVAISSSFSKDLRLFLGGRPLKK